jgi:hypothetical protein
MLWQRVIPMLKCQSILVPLKMVDGYEKVTASLEKQERGGVDKVPGTRRDNQLMGLMLWKDFRLNVLFSLNRLDVL